MRWMRFLLILPLLLSIELAAQQYSDGACLLLQQQIDRFSEHRSNPNYRSARREYDKYCLNRNKTKPAVVKPAQPEPQQPVTSTPQQQSNAENTATKTTPAVTSEPAVSPQTAVSEVKASTEVAKEALSQKPAEAVRSAKPAVNTQSTEQAEQITVPVSAAASQAGQDAAVVESYSAADNDLLMQVLSSIPQLSALVFALLLVVFLLTTWLGFNLPGFKGVFAEYKLYRLLRWRLSKDYLHFRKLRLYTANDEPTVIDHLVLSRTGIFVIAVCSFRGNIRGSVSMANWERKYLGSRKQFMNPLHQNFKNTEAVKHLLQLRGTEVMEHMHSVIAFTRLARFDAAIAENVTFIDDVATYISRFNEAVISETEFARFAAQLRQAESGEQH